MCGYSHKNQLWKVIINYGMNAMFHQQILVSIRTNRVTSRFNRDHVDFKVKLNKKICPIRIEHERNDFLMLNLKNCSIRIELENNFILEVNMAVLNLKKQKSLCSSLTTHLIHTQNLRFNFAKKSLWFWAIH